MSSISSDRSSDYMIMGYRSRTYSTMYLGQENPSTTKRNTFSTTHQGIILGGDLIKQADSDQARYCAAVGQSGVKCSRQRSVNCWQAPIIIYQSVSSLVLLIEFKKCLLPTVKVLDETLLWWNPCFHTIRQLINDLITNFCIDWMSEDLLLE